MSESFLHVVLPLVVAGLACLGALGFLLLYRELQTFHSHGLEVDVSQLAAHIYARAISDYKTDVIPEDELFTYTKFRFLEICSNFGLDPDEQLSVINRVLELAGTHVNSLDDHGVVPDTILFE